MLSKKNYVYFAIFAGNLSALTVGTALTWSSPMIPKLKADNEDDIPFGRKITQDEESWIGSFLPVGAVFGPFLFGLAAGKFGRRPVILSLAIPLVVSFVLMGFGKSVWLFYVARILQGLSAGGCFTVVPMYIGEVSESSNRGMFGASMNVFLSVGMFLSYCIGPYVSILVFHIILVIFPILFFVLFFLISPESPHYLLTKNKEDARIALIKIRGYTAVDKELEDVKDSLEKSQGGSFSDVFKSRALRRAFSIGVGLVFIQQFSGINVVLFYAQSIFAAAGGAIPTDIGPILVGGVQLMSSFVTPVASDRSGRKILMIISCIGMFISEVPLGIFFYLDQNGHDTSKITWLPLVSLISYIIWYGIAIGPLPWALLGELFPSNVKSLASSTTASICWMFAFFITKYFSSISDSIGTGPSFWIFAGFCLLGYFFIQFYVIETKGKSLQEIQDELES